MGGPLVQTSRAAVAAIAAVASVMILSMIIASMSIFGWGWFQRETADFRGQTAQQEQVFADPDYRIASYDSFYDKCATVMSREAQIENLEEELASGPSPDRERIIRTTLTALNNARDEAIQEYNADARKTDTRANFRASDLPHQLDPNEETSCTL